MKTGPSAKKPVSLMKRVIWILCLTIIPFNLLSILLSVRTAGAAYDTYRRSIETSLYSHTDRLSMRMENTDVLLYTYPSTDLDFANLLSGSQNWRYQLYKNNLTISIQNTLRLSDAPDSMFVYFSDTDTLLLVDKLLFNAEDLPEHMSTKQVEGLIQAQTHSDGKWHFYEDGDTRYLLRIIQTPRYSVGAYINCSALLRKLPKQLDISGAQYHFSDQPMDQKLGQLLCASPLPGGQATLYCVIPHNALPMRALYGQLLLMCVFGLSLLIVPVFLNLFRKRINAPLRTLRNAFRELEQGNEDYRIQELSDYEEFQDTFQSFNTMTETVSSLRRKAMEETRQQHELTVRNLSLQLDNLNLQIRPHFLLNTMNLLYTLIQKQQEENAKRLVLYLSKYFRYMVRYGHELEAFSKEIEMVSEFLSISELHYDNAFTVSYQLDPLLNVMRFPPLLLHNFVENIMQHALIPGETIHIVLYGEYNEEEKLVTLQISDDGRGMPEYFVDMINRNDFSSVPPGKHIGIRNSIRRLQHYYEGKGTVSVESIPQGGTTVTITIPQELPID